LDEKNGGPLTALHVSKRGIFRLRFQNLGETLLGVLLVSRPGVGGSNLVKTWFLEFCFFQQ